MKRPGGRAILQAMTASWPPVAEHRIGPWTLREGPGGGNRVTCALAEGPVSPPDLPLLEEGAARLGQYGLVMVRQGDEALDSMLAAHGWGMGEEVVLYLAPASRFTAPPGMAAFALWPPLAVQRLLWDEGGSGPAKQAVMERAERKTAILARTRDRPAGTAFVALGDGIAFVHALTVDPGQRRQGAARDMMGAAGAWALAAGAEWLALAVTRGNAPARSLYASLGMEVVGHYHYRKR